MHQTTKRVLRLAYRSVVICSATVIASGCGGGPETPAATSSVDVRATSVAALEEIRWDQGGVSSIAHASDGGVWAAGVEPGAFGFAFLRKIGGAEPNPCGATGLRLLTELSDVHERHPGITSITPPRDGAFYVAGIAPGSAFISRYLESTCQPDPAFGATGHQVIPTPAFGSRHTVRLALDSQGRAIVAVALTGLVHVRRIGPDGVWDSTFGINGLAANQNVDSFWLSDIALSSADEIYLAGSVSIPFAFLTAIMKLGGSGGIDPLFGTDGIKRYPETSIGTSAALSLIVKPDRVVFIGTTSSSIALGDFITIDSFIAAADARSGDLLSTFGQGGFYRWDWGYQNSNMALSIIPNHRGGYTTCGHVIKSLLAGQPMALADFTEDGQPDNAVGYLGRRLIDRTNAAGCLSILQLPDSSFMLGGNDAKQALVMKVR